MTKSIPLSDNTYWKIREERDTMSKELNRRVTYDDVIRFLLADASGETPPENVITKEG